MVKSSVNIHSWSYYIVLMLIAASLPLSKFTMSITEFLLLALWFWSGFSFKIAFRFFKIGGFFSGIYHLFAYLIKLLIRNFTDKFELFFRNKPAVIFTSLFFIHILGLINTSDFDYALKDLRTPLVSGSIINHGNIEIQAIQVANAVLYCCSFLRDNDKPWINYSG